MSQDADLDTISADAAYFLIPILELNLKAAADAAGWPDELISKLTVAYNNGNLEVNYPSDIEESVNNLEYGAPGSLPRSVIRPFIYRADVLIKQILANQTVDLLMEYEEVF